MIRSNCLSWPGRACTGYPLVCCRAVRIPLLSRL